SLRKRRTPPRPHGLPERRRWNSRALPARDSTLTQEGRLPVQAPNLAPGGTGHRDYLRALAARADDALPALVRHEIPDSPARDVRIPDTNGLGELQLVEDPARGDLATGAVGALRVGLGCDDGCTEYVVLAARKHVGCASGWPGEDP